MTSIDTKELGHLFEVNGAKLVLYARQWFDRQLAEDIVQEVFIRLMAQRRMPTNVRAWLFRATRNAAVSRVRSERRRKKREKQRAADRSNWFNPGPDNSIDAGTIQAALDLLTEGQREVVVLRIWGGLTLQEAADIVGRPVSTVFSRYRSALAQMRRKLESSDAK